MLRSMRASPARIFFSSSVTAESLFSSSKFICCTAFSIMCRPRADGPEKVSAYALVIQICSSRIPAETSRCRSALTQVSAHFQYTPLLPKIKFFSDRQEKAPMEERIHGCLHVTGIPYFATDRRFAALCIGRPALFSTETGYYPGILMLMLLKLALQPSANTPICAPSVECVIRELRAFASSIYRTTISFSQTSFTWCVSEREKSNLVIAAGSYWLSSVISYPS